MSQKVWGQMNNLRLTFIDLQWPQTLHFGTLHDVYQKKAEHPKISCVTTFLFYCWPYDLTWPWFGQLTFLTASILNAKIIGMLHSKCELKTAVLQWKYVQTSERSDEWPQADLHWPLMTSNLSNLEHMHNVYQKKAEHPRISYRDDVRI